MLRHEAVPIEPDLTAGALHDRLAALAATLLVDSLPDLLAGRLTPVAQPTEGVTYAAKIERTEARLDWTLPAEQLARTVRAFAPRPGAYATFDGERIKILAATSEPGTGTPGTVLDACLLIACGDGALRLRQLQRAGRGPLDAEAFLRGFPIARDARFDG